ncbi:MAG: hypothetical protein WC934_11845 [Acidithiobacillus sp.]|jgi:hypothetical protein|uniref:hypothetical protein n=1 Tax=Acidithiobacillus sp. TaxID=1872118 RepID=UPI00355D1F02
MEKFVKKSKLTPSWLYNQIMKSDRKQLLAASEADLYVFFKILKDGKLLMPDGNDSLTWMKMYFKLQLNELEKQLGTRSEWISDKIKYIISCLDEFEIKYKK